MIVDLSDTYTFFDLSSGGNCSKPTHVRGTSIRNHDEFIPGVIQPNLSSLYMSVGAYNPTWSDLGKPLMSSLIMNARAVRALNNHIFHGILFYAPDLLTSHTKARLDCGNPSVSG